MKKFLRVRRKKIKEAKTYPKNDVLDISDPNKEVENLIMIGAIAREEVRKFGQNLKSFQSEKEK